MKRISLLLIALVAVAALTGCTANVQQVQDCVVGDPVGFWEGLWHGFIAPVSFVISLFTDKLTVFEVNNNGNWYLFGFLLGIGAFSSSSGAGVCRSRRRSRK